MTGEEDLRIPASPEDVARAIMEGPPADDWDYLQPGGGDDPDPEADQPAPPEKRKDPGPERGM